MREEAEQFLVERVTALPRKASVKLLIALPETQCGNEQRVTDAIHEDFNFRRIQAEKELHRTRRFGWRSLVVALIFLTAAMLLVQLMKRYLPMGNLMSVMVEGLTVFAWVALWRPGELLLYDWYPFKRDVRLFRKLEKSEIHFSYDTQEEKPARQMANPPAALSP